jgi:hypothetical protein
MSNFKVLWSETGSSVRHARKFETALEARGFVKGLRLGKGLERIGVRFLNSAGDYERVAVADFFKAADDQG